MKLYKTLLLGALLVAAASCSNDEDDETLNPNAGYTAIQQKALTVLNGSWVSEAIVTEQELNGMHFTATSPSDTIVFTSQYATPKTFYAYDYLQGAETENFIACGTCEFRAGLPVVGVSSSCYFYVTPQGDGLYIYNAETETPCKSYELRIENESRFYAGTSYYGSPIYFNKK